MRYPRNLKLIPLAKNLRKNMTPQERHLWYDFLRYCKPNFRRQEIIGDYIVDFFCYDAALAIEVDGSQHFDPLKAQADAERTAYLSSLGIEVLRCDNRQINTEFSAVCQVILNVLQKKHPSVSYADSSPIGEPE